MPLGAYNGMWRAVASEIVRLHHAGYSTADIHRIALQQQGSWVHPYWGMIAESMIRYIGRVELNESCRWGYPERMAKVKRRVLKQAQRKFSQPIGGRVIDMGGQDGKWHTFVLGPEPWR